MAASPARLAVSTGRIFWLYERLMGRAARERAARLLAVSPDQLDRIEVIEVWGPPSGNGPERELRFYDFGGRILALSHSVAA